MSKTTFVQVFECGPEGSRQTHRVPIGLFVGHAMERLSVDEIMRLRSDLAARGQARLHGTSGRWHEYRLASD